ncbi:EAL domain-containing protein [Thauera sp. SWB20]|uniref:EAL domain-containing protein n=1 Tax=Thauera sp. SWB20 TaxID=1572758 RepID=UPI0005ADF5D5|nr:EAL domain-containing protein [Thauera sp. SWB20]KIN91970.1 diguanylate cyclase domain protein [Thauera sp. SWB20]
MDDVRNIRGTAIMRIVIVEDSPLLRDNLIRLFADHPELSVLGSAAGEDAAVALIAAQRPDTVLLDLSLSQGSGLGVLRRLRATPGLAPRVLVLSSRPADPWEALCLDAGADAFLDKAGDPSVLLAQLASWMPPLPLDELRRRRRLQQLQVLDTRAEPALDAIARLAARIAEAPVGVISLVDTHRQWFKARVGVEVQTTSRSVSFCAHALLGDGLFEVEDATLDPRFADNPLVRGDPGIRFYAGMPLVMPGGEVVGTLCVIDSRPRRLGATAREALAVLARSVTDELELRQRVGELEEEVARRHEAEARIMQLATRDALTGLPNRAALMDRLHQGVRAAQRSGNLLAVLFLDLDRFKWINDTLGHDLGDALLQEMALRLSRAVRECDTVARLGGDEFAIVLGDLWQVADAEAVAAKIVDVITRPLEVRGHALRVGGSVGVAVYPFQAHDEESLLRHADLAMYHAKESGGNRHQLFSEQMNARAVERMTVESELRTAIAAGQLELHYQPQLCLEDGRLAGMEALVRWRHPRLGLLAPGRFVPLAEDCGLIWELGLAVLELALAQLAAWDRAGLEVPRIAVNVSPAQLRPELVERIVEILDRHGVAARRLEIELTESALTADGPAANGLLQALRRMGASIAIDDFGVGYSSLTLLRRLPISALKIDRSFVAELATNRQDAAIVEAILRMAHSVGLRTVAEGVEHAEQQAALGELGCQEVQGYLCARPLEAKAASAWLAGQHAGGLVPSAAAA